MADLIWPCLRGLAAIRHPSGAPVLEAHQGGWDANGCELSRNLLKDVGGCEWMRMDVGGC